MECKQVAPQLTSSGWRMISSWMRFFMRRHAKWPAFSASIAVFGREVAAAASA
jgi:hypothetical protein